MLIAVILVPLVLALSEGSDLGLGVGWDDRMPRDLAWSRCSRSSGRGARARRRSSICSCSATAILVGSTLAILIVAGTINALMYVLSLYFQDPAGVRHDRAQGGARDAAGRRGDDR